MTIDEFINKYENEFNFNIGHFPVAGDYTIEFKKLFIDKFNLEFLKELINDFENNKKNWEQENIFKGCK